MSGLNVNARNSVREPAIAVARSWAPPDMRETPMPSWHPIAPWSTDRGAEPEGEADRNRLAASQFVPFIIFFQALMLWIVLRPF